MKKKTIVNHSILKPGHWQGAVGYQILHQLPQKLLQLQNIKTSTTATTQTKTTAATISLTTIPTSGARPVTSSATALTVTIH